MVQRLWSASIILLAVLGGVLQQCSLCRSEQFITDRPIRQCACNSTQVDILSPGIKACSCCVPDDPGLIAYVSAYAGPINMMRMLWSSSGCAGGKVCSWTGSGCPGVMGGGWRHLHCTLQAVQDGGGAQEELGGGSGGQWAAVALGGSPKPCCLAPHRLRSAQHQ